MLYWSSILHKFHNKQTTMELLYNNQIINQIVQKLFKHRRNDYSEHPLDHALALHQIEHQLLPIHNKHKEKLHVSLFNKQTDNTVCILYLHGYGSNRLECLHLLRTLPKHYSLCAFDFSGSGKSQGEVVSYGMKQKQDIHCVLKHLKTLQYDKFILWGRSMGATSALLYCLKYHPQDVVLQVIDSPFYSFQLIAQQIANRSVKAPQFLISFALNMARQNCKNLDKFNYNPFQIQLSNVDQCTIAALFVYCEQDNVINPKNTVMICSKFKATYQKLVIEENHNTIRSKETIDKIVGYIDKYVKKQKIPSTVRSSHVDNIYYHTKDSGKKMHLHLETPKSCHSSKEGLFSSDSKNKKGIERVSVKGKRFDDYGIWVASKFTTQMPMTPQGSQLRKTSHSAKRTHLSLSNSFNAVSPKEGLSSPVSLVREHRIEHQIGTMYNSTANKVIGSQKEKRLKKVSTMKSMEMNVLNHNKYL